MKYLIHFVDRESGKAGTAQFATSAERLNCRQFVECHKFAVTRFEDLPTVCDPDPSGNASETLLDIGSVLDMVNSRQKPLPVSVVLESAPDPAGVSWVKNNLLDKG